MDILNSNWLIGMLDKSSDSERQRLLNLFDILHDWLQAPHIREHLAPDPVTENSAPAALLQYLAEQGRDSNAQAPEALAHQLYFMALGALQQELQMPGCGSLAHARQAAGALINAQLQSRVKPGPVAYGIAASMAIVASLSSFLLFGTSSQQQNVIHSAALPAPHLLQTMPATYANPAHTAEMYASIEQMRNGVCHYPEAVMLPENQRSVYMQNVVGGEVPTDVMEQALAIRLMQRVHCQYAPMLMKNSIS
jgi:hypothetical protein